MFSSHCVLFSTKDESHMRQTWQPGTVNKELKQTQVNEDINRYTFHSPKSSSSNDFFLRVFCAVFCWFIFGINRFFSTSPMFVGVAPISCWRLSMSLVGPAIREVPVSTIAWQPWGQKESTPCTATLKHTHSDHFPCLHVWCATSYSIIMTTKAPHKNWHSCYFTEPHWLICFLLLSYSGYSVYQL